MKRHLLLLVALLLCRILLPAQNLSTYATGSIGSTTFAWPCTGLDASPFNGCCTSCENKERQIKTEYPPYIIGGGWRTYFFTNGSQSSIASHPNSMVYSGELNFKNNGSAPTLITQPSGCTGVAANDHFEPWRYEYYCAYSAQYINHPTAGTVSVAFVEGENYELPGVVDPGSVCGSQGVDITTGFLCLAYTPNTQATNWGHQYFTDMGPIIWPATGYFLPNDYKSSYGCANNTTIQADDGYLYVFYKDQSYYDIGQQMGAGRLPGIKVARAPINDALNPYAYKTFYEDASGNIYWNQSLPAGLTKSNIKDYYKTLGPQGTTLLESDRDYRRFAVAKVAGKNYYMGVGYFMDQDPNHRWIDSDGDMVSPEIMTLKFSYDLMHWFGDRQIYSASSYKTTLFNYPIFLSADGWTNTSIDENNFYVIGTSPENNGVKNVVYKMQVYIPAPPPPPPPPPPGPCVDQWGNQIICPICYDGQGRPYDCGDHGPDAPFRMATTPGTSAALDNSKEHASFVYPNPGPGVYRLSYTLKGHAKTQLNVLDLMGRQIQTGSAVSRKAGTYTETVNISGYAKGIYLLELLVNGKKQTFKVIYNK
jgi:hypothetical protein